MKVDLEDHLTRCPWSVTDPLLRVYHDQEWGMPQRDGRALWETLMLEGFQAGLSWLTILRRREAFRQAFKKFDPNKVALFGQPEIKKLLGNVGIIRSRAKIEATIAGAKIYVAMEKSGESFSDFVWTMAGNRTIQNKGPVPASTPLSKRMSKELKNRGFKFVGPVIVYAWMQAVGMVNDHQPTCFRRHQVQLKNH